MCALDAAGFAADESTLSEMPSRLALREAMLKMQGPATEALRQFYRDHLLGDPGETLSRYITFSLVVGPPPRFDFQMNHDLLPPDVLTIEGFREILPAFYQEARLDLQWAKVQPEYEHAAAAYGPPVRKIMFTTNSYLREILKPIYDRTFTVYVEPLVGARTNFRNSGSHYSIVVGTTARIPTEQIQHAYLHFVLDPLPLQYRKQVESKRALLLVAARAPRLPEEYRNDFVAFTDECFIKSVELRLRRLPPAQLESALNEADQTGFVLVRPFVAGLQKFEKSEPSMTYYFRDLIAAIDVPAEQKRLQSVTFSPEVPPAPAKQESDTAASASELDRLLAKGDREIARRDAKAASATFESILAKYPGLPKAEYGLAIASVMAGNADRAEKLFAQLVSPAPASTTASKAEDAADPAILSWSHVYLGRIHDLEGERRRSRVSSARCGTGLTERLPGELHVRPVLRRRQSGRGRGRRVRQREPREQRDLRQQGRLRPGLQVPALLRRRQRRRVRGRALRSSLPHGRRGRGVQGRPQAAQRKESRYRRPHRRRCVRLRPVNASGCGF